MNKALEHWIKQCEGFKSKPYADTLGHLTIGYGRNLEKGITVEEADYLFQNDLKNSINDLSQYPWFNMQPENVKMALINMAFNIGICKLITFDHMIRALKDRNYDDAATEALKSKWAKQVGKRAQDVAEMIRKGNYDTEGRRDIAD